jgi:hypothetical protein
MGEIFDGTDMYAFTFQTMAMFSETMILLIAGRLYKAKFSKVCNYILRWKKMIQAAHFLFSLNSIFTYCLYLHISYISTYRYI